MTMTSSKPYLIRAIYDWIVDNEQTPYIVVNANVSGVQVPNQYVQEGKIILNISPQACRGLHLENTRIVFSARFSGVATQVSLPPQAVMAVYAKENGRGMVFDEEEDDDGAPPPHTTTTTTTKGRPSLKLVK